MSTIRYVYWQDGPFWLGHLEDYPDYITQGESLQGLQEHLRDLLLDVTSGEVPGIRHVAELTLPGSGPASFESSNHPAVS